jgi:hypothetical protein
MMVVIIFAFANTIHGGISLIATLLLVRYDLDICSSPWFIILGG